MFLTVPARAASIFPGSPFSSKAAGTTSAAFLKMPNGARYEALGGAAAAAVEGADSLFWNPAGLAGLTEASPSDLALSYRALLEGAYAGGAAYARPRVGPGTLGLGLVYFSQPSLRSYNSVGDPTGSFAPSDIAVSAAYGATVMGLRAGAAVKLIRQSLAEVSGMSGAVDAGVQAEHVADVGDGALDVGAALSNLGPPLKLGSAAAPLPFSLRSGFLWHASSNFNAILDVVLPVDDAPYVTIGGEAFLKQPQYTASLRLGFDQSHTRHIDGLTGLTAGAGIDMERFRLDYAWVPFGDLGMTNRISLAFRFDGLSGAAERQPPRAAASDDQKLLEAVTLTHAPGAALSAADLNAAGARASLSAQATSAAARSLGQQARLALLSEGSAVSVDLSAEPVDKRLAAAAAAARRGVTKLSSRSALAHLQAVSLLEAAARAYLVAPALS